MTSGFIFLLIGAAFTVEHLTHHSVTHYTGIPGWFLLVFGIYLIANAVDHALLYKKRDKERK